MPDKWYKRGCGTSCLRCWRNKLKHGNKEAKAFLKAHPELDWSVHSASKKPTRRAKQQQPTKSQHARDARTRQQDMYTPQQVAELMQQLAAL